MPLRLLVSFRLIHVVMLFGVAAPGSGQGRQANRGEINTPPAKGERKNTPYRPGDLAPDFTLSNLSKTKKVKLADFRNQKPVVLIFGSYT